MRPRKILLLPLLQICVVKGSFVVIKPGDQPSRLPEAPFFLGKCKNNVKASERKLTVSIKAQDRVLPFNLVDAQLQCQIEISGILRKAAWECSN